MSYQYPSLADAKTVLSKIGEVIAKNGLPREFGPFTFVFTGNGNVSKVYSLKQTSTYDFILF